MPSDRAAGRARSWHQSSGSARSAADQGREQGRGHRRGRHGRRRLGPNRAAARVERALQRPLPVPRGADAELLRRPGRQALLLLRLRQGRGRRALRPGDGEPRLRRRDRVARRAVPRPARVRGVVASRGRGAAAARAADRPPRAGDGVLRADALGDGGGRACAGVPRRARARGGDARASSASASRAGRGSSRRPGSVASPSRR